MISGCIGPKGDAYKTNQRLNCRECRDYHAEQIDTFKDAGADIVTALTLNTTDEAIGIARAAAEAGIPSVIAFTIEKDRKLRSGETLKQAIETVDAATSNAPAYYMINCSHPVDFGPALASEPWATASVDFGPTRHLWIMALCASWAISKRAILMNWRTNTLISGPPIQK